MQQLGLVPVVPCGAFTAVGEIAAAKIDATDLMAGVAQRKSKLAEKGGRCALQGKEGATHRKLWGGGRNLTDTVTGTLREAFCVTRHASATRISAQHSSVSRFQIQET